ncbi:MAG: hypothetical protein JJT78_18510 [Leptospira sp.]|nr:hypothetical protein [Leptospira sp.]
MKYIIFTTILLVSFTFCQSVPPLESSYPYYLPKNLGAPEISSYNEIGRVSGTACKKGNNFYFKESPGTGYGTHFDGVFKNNIKIEEEDWELIHSAFSNAISKNPDIDVIVNSRYSKVFSTEGECITYIGEGLEITGIKNHANFPSIVTQPKSVAKTLSETDRPKISLLGIPITILNVLYTGGFLSSEYTTNNKKGICNVPLWGGVANMVTLGVACSISSEKRNEPQTSCESPFLGGIVNVATFGISCNYPRQLYY